MEGDEIRRKTRDTDAAWRVEYEFSTGHTSQAAACEDAQRVKERANAAACSQMQVSARANRRRICQRK
ncbi:hypothetical protein SDC9_169678 [bioreactor metagenome]|uniref:Uncharacterized protein n=1 Tax=bioreactor metagenome TaxID=1076179 RepID=A0A645G6M3_9ZZZZ